VSNAASENRVAAVALLVLGFFIALTCVSAIGAAASLVILTPEERAPRGGDCVVVAWNTGMIYCQGAKSGEANKPMRFSPSVVAVAPSPASVK